MAFSFQHNKNLGVVLLFNIALPFHIMYVAFAEAEIGIYMDTQKHLNKGTIKYRKFKVLGTRAFILEL